MPELRRTPQANHMADERFSASSSVSSLCKGEGVDGSSPCSFELLVVR